MSPRGTTRSFGEAFGAERPGTRIGALDHKTIATNPLEFADEKFTRYIEDRRREPRADVLCPVVDRQR